jgi:hypothetical protein
MPSRRSRAMPLRNKSYSGNDPSSDSHHPRPRANAIGITDEWILNAIPVGASTSSDFVVPNSDRLLSSVDVGFNTLLCVIPHQRLNCRGLYCRVEHDQKWYRSKKKVGCDLPATVCG